MRDIQAVTLNFKIGVLKELHKRELINKVQLDKAIKIIINTAEGENEP
jgi:hypothetical protein